jgi:hypothetical protein
MVNLFYRSTTLLCFFIFANFVIAQSQVISNPTVSQPIKMGISQPMRDLPLNSGKIIENWKDGIIPLRTPFDMEVQDIEKDGSLKDFKGPFGATNISQNFDGVGAGGYAPPDPSGDVGPNHYVQMVNVQTQIWDKNGTSLAGPFNNSNFWAGLPGPWSSSNDGDPIVLYDEIADRWMVSQFALPNYPNGPFYILIAVSTTPDPTGAYYQYAYSYPDFPDYPKFGVWPDGYYMSANIFQSGTFNYLGTYATVFDRNTMLSGGAATMQNFTLPSSTWSFLPSDCDGIFPPDGSPNYFISTYNGFGGGSTDIDIYEFHTDWTTPANSSFTGPLLLTTPSFSQPNEIPQLGTTNTLNTLSDRPMNRLQYRNMGDHESMVFCQTVNAGSGRAGMRWWELQKTSGDWSIYQESTFAPADGLNRWMGSVAMDENGSIALGYSTSSSIIYPDIRFTGRFASDPLGVMTIAETVIHAGNGSQTTGLSRWGDYTQMTVDPSNSGTFWYTNQYIPTNGTFNWKTRIAAFSFELPCPVGYASNPSPADNATDVPITASEATWDNPVDATSNEFWFGTDPGSLTLLQSGSLATSFAIPPGTLVYNTNYYWRVDCANDTCSSTGVLWSFKTMQDPLLVVDTIDVYPQSADYWTGTTNASSKTQVSLVDGRNTTDGWMKFDISAIPDSANVTSVTFHGYVNSTIWPWWSITPMPIDPVTATAADVFSAIQTGEDDGIAYLYSDESSGYTTGQKTYPLVEGNIISDFNAALSSGWFAIGISSRDNNTSYYITFDGWNEANPPYLEVMYEYLIPVELTSFTANVSNNSVNLKWNTATELNNSGFEVQRKSSNSEWSNIGFVAGFGTTTESKVYSFTDDKAAVGNFTYRLKQVDFDGSYEYSNEINVDVTGPAQYSLDQNYPNPFNPSTLIKYSVAQDGFVNVSIFNLLGEKVATLVNSNMKAGSYELNFNASQLSSGVYFYSIEAGDFKAVRKMMLMK